MIWKSLINDTFSHLSWVLNQLNYNATVLNQFNYIWKGLVNDTFSTSEFWSVEYSRRQVENQECLHQVNMECGSGA